MNSVGPQIIQVLLEATSLTGKEENSNPAKNLSTPSGIAYHFGKKNSNWLKFQEAVKFNQKLAESILSPLITKLELPFNLW